jgi:hypothetical protein
MEKYIIIYGIVFAFLMIVFSGCTEQNNSTFDNEEQKFVGTWQDNSIHEQIYTFETGDMTNSLEIIAESGTFALNLDVTGNWRIDGDRLIMSADIDQTNTYTYHYYYRFEDDNTLLLTTVGKNPESITLIRI